MRSVKTNYCVFCVCLQKSTLQYLVHYLSCKMNHFGEIFPNAELVILAVFIVSNTNCLKYSTHSDGAGLDADALPIVNDLTRDRDNATGTTCVPVS